TYQASGSAQRLPREPRQAGNGATVVAAACVAGRSEAWPISERVAAGKACRTAPRWSTIQRRRRRLRTKRPRRLFSVYAAPPEEDVTKKAEAARARGESCLRCHRTDYK